MRDLLIILTPPRSFSSVVSTMIGEHPELYGFPELHLFSAEYVEELVQHKMKGGKAGPPGLIRTLAQEHDGLQSTKTILKATDWFLERRNWTTKKLMEYLLDLVSPRMGVEKSPQTTKKMRYIERTQQWFPNAYYLHLTRHPVSARNSIQEFLGHKASKNKDKKSTLRNSFADGFFAWYHMHTNIINFTDTLPVGQVMRIKGEDLLSEPDIYLPQIAQWLGLRTDSEAIEAMKHPENSPYAYVGPAPSPGGNDPKFMRNPQLRGGKLKEPSLQDFLTKEEWIWPSDEIKEMLLQEGIQLSSRDNFADEIVRLANLMGYQ
jgi:hypothetical protein